MWSGRLGYCGHLGLHSAAVAEDRHTLTACMRLMSGRCSGLTDCSHDRFLKVCAFGEGVMQRSNQQQLATEDTERNGPSSLGARRIWLVPRSFVVLS